MRLLGRKIILKVMKKLTLWKSVIGHKTIS